MKLAFLLVAALTPLISFAQMDSLSHSLGIVLAKSVQQQGLPVTDHDAFAAGFKQAMTTDISQEDVQKAQMAIQMHMEQAQASKSSAAKGEGEAFLKTNGTRPEVTTTASGLQYEVLTEGEGAHPSATDKVTVHYTGKNLDGSVFDSSVERGQPATFPLNGVIAGWTEGVQLMKPGSKYRFFIPSELAYGERGAGADIAPGATLMFDVELISIN
ncbi:MAG: FKBP-type peptidyl-prolyl cis-trans isomerase [Saprospiraceae bacterium]